MLMFGKAQWLLLCVLLLQLVFITWTVVDSSSSAIEEIPLIALDRSEINQIVLEKHTQPPLTISNTDGGWLLPQFKQVNVSTHMVETLLNQLLKIKTSWPVAQTKTAAKQFQVEDNNYLAKISLTSTKRKHVDLLLGLSPGFKSTYARVAGSNDIYLISFDVLTMSVASKYWSDQENSGNEKTEKNNDQPS
jgi:hypothetical protein